jgi:chromosome segregation ATPase
MSFFDNLTSVSNNNGSVSNNNGSVSNNNGSTEPKFLTDFQSSMNKLAQIRKEIQDSVQFKEQFTNELKEGLGGIKTKIETLSGLINELKTKAADLEGQVNTNKTSIDNKEGELEKLKDQITSLTNDKERLNTQIKAEKQAAKNEIDELQRKINYYENQLGELNKRIATKNAEEEGEELYNQLTGIVSPSTQTAKLEAENSPKELQDQKDELIEKISGYKREIDEFKEKISNKDIELAEKQKTIQEARGQAQTSAQSLQQEIDNLKADNQVLIKRIIDATTAINEANDELQNIVNIVPNPQTKKDVDKLLNLITQQLESSIQNISSTLQGQTSSENINSFDTVNNVIKETETSTVDNNNNKIYYDKILHLLNYNMANKNHNDAYKEMINLTNSSPSEVDNILKKYNLEFKDGEINGGRKTRKITKRRKITKTRKITKAKKARKTRKIRKQKGGFIYKPNTKRKKIRTSQLRNVSRRTFR